ncbi:TonB-dependent receptor [Bacteroidota bacterium]
MKNRIVLFFILFVSNSALSQNVGKLNIDIDEIILTATRSPNYLKNIPGRIEIIDQKIISDFPANTLDELLFVLPGLNVNRSWGIFSKNASVTLRGLNGTDRVLVLLNGLPLNKSAGGGINWHMITPNQVKQIEVCKGPGSSVYGNNAMAGVINIITKKPAETFGGEIGFETGTYGTIGSSLNLSGRKNKDKGLYWNLNLMGRKGDGYILEPVENRDSTDSNAYLKELSAGTTLAYHFKNSVIELDYNFYKDKRGSGTKIYEKDGSFLSYTTNYLSAKFKGQSNKWFYEIKSFFQLQNYFEESESFNSYAEYKLYDIDQTSYDQGIWINLSKNITDNQRVTFGLDGKVASFDAIDDYKTSSDYSNRKGKTALFALFAQDEIKLLKDKLHLVAGLRADFSNFYDGEFDIKNPTKNTGFADDKTILYESSAWAAISPRLVMKYNFNDNLSAYISYSVGFMPASLDDLCSSRKIRKGFKMANPDLKPEKLFNYETGINLTIWNKLDIKPSVYYSIGKDFQYFVGTGDSIDTGGLSFKPILRRENISNVMIAGAEISINYLISNSLNVISNYSYNYSEIINFDLTSYYGTDLKGKHLNEVPNHQFFTGLNWKNKITNVFMSSRYNGPQYYDEENTTMIDSYWQFDINLSRKIKNNIHIALSIQNLFNKRFIDKKQLLSPGRFINLSVRYKL